MIASNTAIPYLMSQIGTHFTPNLIAPMKNMGYEFDGSKLVGVPVTFNQAAKLPVGSIVQLHYPTKAEANEYWCSEPLQFSGLVSGGLRFGPGTFPRHFFKDTVIGVVRSLPAGEPIIEPTFETLRIKDARAGTVLRISDGRLYLRTLNGVSRLVDTGKGGVQLASALQERRDELLETEAHIVGWMKFPASLMATAAE